jgi:TIR- and PNP-associating SLOG family
MVRSPLFGRRIHIAGSVDPDPSVADPAEVEAARELVKLLTAELVARGATFVLPVDRDNVRPADGLPICFDWLVWETLDANLLRRPSGASEPLAIAVQHHKTEDQIPPRHEAMWDRLRDSSAVKIENAAQWNMNAKRMELQARWGDILIAIGGGEGVHHLANLYHDAGKPVIPLMFKVCPPHVGARRLFEFGLASSQTARLFRTDGALDPQGWINRLNFGRSDNAKRVATLIALLESLRRPTAFGVRLLDPSNPEYPAVQDFFDSVVKPVVEDE